MGELFLQGGRNAISASRDNKLGIVAIQLKCRAESLADALTAPAPDIGLGISLPEMRPRNVSMMDSGIECWDVTCTMEGHLSPETADGEEYELQGATSQEPIETHPQYLDLLKVYKGDANAQDRSKIWPKDLTTTPSFGFTDAAGSAAADLNGGASSQRNPMHGIMDYLVPGLLWTRRWVSSKIDIEDVRNLATITSSPPGNPPRLTGHRNWLLIRVVARFRGNIWQLEASWQCSGPFGWVHEMYRYY